MRKRLAPPKSIFFIVIKQFMGNALVTFDTSLALLDPLLHFHI